MFNGANGAFFVKDGVPVKFCFHRSVTQGRVKITRDVERNGGQIVANERVANVLLVDEEEDLDLTRRQYYSSSQLYRHSIYVEPRGFVQACIRLGRYRHEKPVRKGMPGRAPGARPRMAFTEEDEKNLARYLATRFPTRDGRLGMNAYKDLERLGQTDDADWEWARRHTRHSWREHYKMNPRAMDERIEEHIRRLKNAGHHYGRDHRSHDLRNPRRVIAEEDEEGGEEEGEGDEDEDEEQWEGIARQRERDRPASVPYGQRDQATRNCLPRREQDLVTSDDEEGEDDIQEGGGEVIVQVPQGVKHHRVVPDAHVRHDSREARAKKVRISGASSHSPGVEADYSESSPAREQDTDMGESEEIEGNDLFGDRMYEDDQGVEFAPAPFSPQMGPIPEQSNVFLATQTTLIASPHISKVQPSSAAETAQLSPLLPPLSAVPSSSQITLVSTERNDVERARVRGASAEPGPSMPGHSMIPGGAFDAPFRNTRARSRSLWSVDPEPQAVQQRKARTNEDALIEEVRSESLVEENQVDVEVNADEDEDGGISDISGPELPQIQEVTIGDDPSDSDDAETHAFLVQGALQDGESGSEEEDDGDRIERMASGKFPTAPVPTPPQRRVTRSMMPSRQISPPRTRSGKNG